MANELSAVKLNIISDIYNRSNKLPMQQVVFTSRVVAALAQLSYARLIYVSPTIYGFSLALSCEVQMILAKVRQGWTRSEIISYFEAEAERDIEFELDCLEEIGVFSLDKFGALHLNYRFC